MDTVDFLSLSAHTRAQVQAGLLERLQMLQDAEAIPLTSKLVTSTEFQHQHMRNNVCWPVASNSDER